MWVKIKIMPISNNDKNTKNKYILILLIELSWMSTKMLTVQSLYYSISTSRNLSYRILT